MSSGITPGISSRPSPPAPSSSIKPPTMTSNFTNASAAGGGKNSALKPTGSMPKSKMAPKMSYRGGKK